LFTQLIFILKLFFFCLLLFSASPESIAGNHLFHFKKLLHYKPLFFKKGFKSSATEKFFFVHPKGHQNPSLEIEASLEAIRSNRPVGRMKKHFACSFPARYQILKEMEPTLKSNPIECPELTNWLEAFGATNSYIVYSSAYPSNPASMFGHTFLRFDRLVDKKSNTTSDLRGYSISFMATIDPSDNPIEYTFRGLAGGYDGHINIKPYYMNVGIYNNAESRDLWEYEINLNKDEMTFLLKHVWEIMQNTGFSYYFFDENCSWMILKILEAVRPHIEFHSANDLFVLPQETLKDIALHFNSPKPKRRESLGSKIERKYRDLSMRKQELFSKALKSNEVLENINSYSLLDLLALEWKYRNYKAKTHLSDREKNLFMTTYRKLAKTSKSEKKELNRPIIKDNHPIKAHNIHNMRAVLGNEWHKLTVRYGIHDIHDPPTGYAPNALITAFQADLAYREDKIELDQLMVIDITSLENFYLYYPKISWKIRLSVNNLEEDQSFFPTSPILHGGIGLSHHFKYLQFYFIPGLISWYHNEKYHINAAIHTGGKIQMHPTFMLSGEKVHVIEEADHVDHYKLSLLYTPIENYTLAIKLEKPSGQSIKNIGLEFGLYF
jgi:hypothetical protein